MWDLPDTFAAVASRGNPGAVITCTFAGDVFGAEIVSHRQGRHYRIFLQEELRAALARTFLMSYMRELDTKLREVDAPGSSRSRDHESERSFWEFVDLEFDGASRHLRIVAHYVQRPDFPHLFTRLAGSPPMRQIADELRDKGESRIHKQPWRERTRFQTEIGAHNVIYMLCDCANGLFYVGEAEDMVARFRRGHTPIPNWTHYRYDLLPRSLAGTRVTIERMLICDADAIIGRWATDLPLAPGGFRLVNTKIDR